MLFGEGNFHVYYGIAAHHVGLMRRLHQSNASASRLFIKACENNCNIYETNNSTQGSTLDFTGILTNIVEPALNQLTNEMQQILSGEVTGQNLKSYFPTKYNSGQIGDELKDLCELLELDRSLLSQVGNCASKIRTLYDYENSFEVASRILKVAKRLKLNGDFHTVEMLSNQVGGFPISPNLFSRPCKIFGLSP